MMIANRRRGLGATVVYTNPETGYRAWDVPGWCSYTPFSSFMSSCQPPTPAQIAETTMSNMGAAAANNPAVAQQVSTIANVSPTDPYYCQADPVGCAAYKAATENPTCAAIFGTDTMGQLICGQYQWLLIAGGAVLLIALVSR